MRGIPVKMIATNDGGYALLARTDFFANYYNKMCLFKYDSLGNLLWFHKYSTPVDSGGMGPYDIKQTQNDNFIIVGGAGFNNFGYGFYLQTNSIGDTLQLRFYNYINGLRFYKSLLINNKNYVLGGNYYLYFHVFDGNSNLLNIDSNEVFGAYFNLYNINSNKILLCKNINGYKTTYLYTDTLLNHFFEKEYFLKASISSVTSDSGFVFIDYPNNMFKISSALDSLWYRPSSDFEFSGFTSQMATDVTSTNDGGFAFCGNINNNFVQGTYLIKTDSFGTKQWAKNYSFLYVPDNVVSVLQAADSGYVMFQSGLPDSTNIPKMWLVKYASDGTLTNEDFAKTDETDIINIFPNPSAQEINIEFQYIFNGSVELYDLKGTFIKNILINNLNKLNIPIYELQNGIYVLVFKSNSENRKISKRIIKIDY